MNAPTRPVLRYQGGKWRIAEWVIAHLPPHHTYVEPFGGAGSVLLRKPRSPIEVYNDLDADLVSLFRILRDPARNEQLRRLVELTPWSRAEFLAAWGPSTGCALEDARRLIVRTAQSVGNKRSLSRNGWRARATHNSPTDGWARWPAQFPLYLDRIREVMIEQSPWQAILDHYDTPETCFYVDPPYLPETRSRHHRSAYNFELSEADHTELLVRLQEVSGMVVLSGYPSTLYRELLAGWLQVETHARAQTNAPRVEVMWLNPAAAAAIRQPGLV